MNLTEIHRELRRRELLRSLFDEFWRGREKSASEAGYQKPLHQVFIDEINETHPGLIVDNEEVLRLIRMAYSK